MRETPARGRCYEALSRRPEDSFDGINRITTIVETDQDDRLPDSDLC
jgi:hypothetical protein